MIEKQLPILHPVAPDGLHRNSDVPRQGAQGADKKAAPEKKVRQAGVLIPLVNQAREWHILFIRRAENKLDRHSGQVAFPGGARDSEDSSLLDTALRETQEEIGVTADRIKILGQIENYFTISNYQVTPIIGIIQWPSNLHLEESEVARAFLIPIAWLRDQQNFTFRSRAELDTQSARRHPIIVFNPYDGETLWGATARMTLNFLKAVDDGNILLPSEA